MGELPARFWHCYVKLENNKKYAVDNDLTLDELRARIVSPWHLSAPFTVSGKIISRESKLEEIKVTRTDEPQSVWAERHNAQQRSRGICDLATDRSMLPILHGQDYTHELLFAGRMERPPAADVDLVAQVCKRVAAAGRILSERQRKQKPPFVIEDEYDVQDLLHAVLRAYLKYSVQEDPLPKTAGTKSGRADISIEELGALIEIKFVRSPGDQRRLVEEFSQDLVLYASWEKLETLLFVIYNSAQLRDPEALEKLGGPKMINESKFDVRVILA